jgi:large conductance mechanosensitive channel
MKMLDEFKRFTLKGNVLDLSVGVIIGGAVSTIVNSLIKDIIMPVIGMVTNGIDFSNQFIHLASLPANFKDNPDPFKDLQNAGVAVFGYGSFLTAVLNFIILAFIIFLMVKFVGKLRAQELPAPEPELPLREEIALLREIRDALKKGE